MTEVLRKKITRQGTSKCLVIPAKFLAVNHLKLGDEIEMVVNDDYILIKDCRNPFLRDLLAQEIETLYHLSFLRKQKIEDTQKQFDVGMKAMEDGSFKGQSVDDLPPWQKELDADVAKFGDKIKPQEDVGYKIRAAKARYELGKKEAESTSVSEVKEKSDKNDGKRNS